MFHRKYLALVIIALSVASSACAEEAQDVNAPESSARSAYVKHAEEAAKPETHKSITETTDSTQDKEDQARDIPTPAVDTCAACPFHKN